MKVDFKLLNTSEFNFLVSVVNILLVLVVKLFSLIFGEFLCGVLQFLFEIAFEFAIGFSLVIF
jgi:hypothetical protein